METDLATAAYSEDDATPAPADAQMNQYTLAPGDIDDRVYDENGNILRTGQALPPFYEHDYRDRIVRAARAPEIDSANGVPAGSVFSDDFATGLDAAWEHNPASAGGVLSAPWPWNAGGCLAHGGGPTPASSALPRTNPDGDFWWVYTRPSGASGNDVLDAYLRITGQNTDTTFDAEFPKLDIDADGISLWREGTGGQLASAPVATADDTPYLIHAHVFRDQVVIRRGLLGQPLATVLRADNAPVQGTDRFVLEASNACLVDDVNIGDGVSEYVYDALGRRIEKRAGGGATRYLHDGARVAEEWAVPAAGSPALAASYVYGNYIDEVLTMRRGGVDYYYHADDQHNVVKLTDSAGAVVEAYDYADYGLPEFFDATGARLDVTASQFANPYLFTGRQWDAELGYYYYRNRYLDPAHGRFASRDPLGLWGDPLNLGNGYTYAGSNPWSLVDPFGLCSGNQSRLPRWGERSYPEEVFAVAKGYFWDTTVGAAIGIGKAAINYEDTFASARDTLNFAWEDPEGFRDAVGKGVGQAIENALENPESAGTAISGFVTTFFGGYGLVKGAANAAETTVDIAGDAARAATRARVLSNIAESQGARIEGGLNLFKWGSSTTTRNTGWRPGDSMLYLPDRGSPKANWRQNSSRLREFMSMGRPIFDSYRYSDTGLQIPTGGFLRAERHLLESRSWRYSPRTGAYHPPRS